MSVSAPLRLAWLVPGSVLAVAALAYGTFGTVGLLAFERDEVREVVTEVVHTLEVAADGAVRVEGEARDDVAVEARLVRGLSRPDHRVRVGDGRLEVDGSCPALSFGWCEIAYTLRVPVDVAVIVDGAGRVRVADVAGPVTVDVHGGPVDLHRVTGGADVETRGGGVTATDVAGPLRLHTRGGAVEGRDLRSESVEASTLGGPVELDFVVEPRHVVATTRGGGVRVEVPDTPVAYDVDATSRGGDTRTDVRTDPTSDRTITARSHGGDVVVTYPGAS